MDVNAPVEATFLRAEFRGTCSSGGGSNSDVGLVCLAHLSHVICNNELASGEYLEMIVKDVLCRPVQRCVPLVQRAVRTGSASQARLVAVCAFVLIYDVKLGHRLTQSRWGPRAEWSFLGTCAAAMLVRFR